MGFSALDEMGLGRGMPTRRARMLWSMAWKARAWLAKASGLLLLLVVVSQGGVEEEGGGAGLVPGEKDLLLLEGGGGGRKSESVERSETVRFASLRPRGLPERVGVPSSERMRWAKPSRPEGRSREVLRPSSEKRAVRSVVGVAVMGAEDWETGLASAVCYLECLAALLEQVVEARDGLPVSSDLVAERLKNLEQPRET
jgi:hypothetical protein